MSLKETLEQKEFIKKRLGELKEELKKYPPLTFDGDEDIQNKIVIAMNNIENYSEDLEIIEELERDFIPKEYIKQKLKELKRDIKKCGSTDVITRHIMANEIEFLEKLVKEE